MQLAAAAAQALDGRNEAEPADRLEEQARGNQSFLLQAFYDDLVKLAETSVFDGSNPPLSTLPSGRPTLLDTGMVLCLKAKKKPTWINKYDKNGTYPTLKFKHAPYEAATFTLRPVVDFDMVDFAKNPPVFVDATTYFDEEVIGLAFDLDWGGRKPLFAKDAREDVEAYVRAYHIAFLDFETRTLIRAATTIPAKVDLTRSPVTNPADPTTPIYDALRSRYQYTVPRNEVAPEESAAALRARRIEVRVRPISQTGHYGASFTDELKLEPTLTPLPADDAHLTMSLPESGDELQAMVEWRQLALPPIAGVAHTKGWHLVLRPPRGVPLGAYPDDAVDVTDRGLMSATGQALIEGDIVIKLYRDEAEAKAAGLTWKCPEAGIDDRPEQDPAEKIFTLDLTSKKLPGTVYDHRGRKQGASSPLFKASKAFFEHTSAASRDGYAWRLFLRATADYDNDEALARGAAVSGLAPVRLLLKVRGKQPEAPPLRPLSHFEWPVRTTYPQVDGADITASAGPVRVAVVQHGAGGSVPALAFVQKPGRSRAITVSWNAIPSETGASRPLQAVAAYDVFELPLDMLVNADLDPASGFKPDWRWLRRIVPTDADQASQIPATLADVQNWEAQYPSFARTVDHLGRAGVDPREMPARWPDWYSWDESELKWPRAPFSDAIVVAESSQPLGTFAQDLLTPAEKLAIWRELGRAITKGVLHDYLACLVGHMADQGGIGAEARFEVQLIASQPTAVTDPLKWLMANTATLDPYGWAALSRLGLCVTLALRDPVTGLLLSQRTLCEKYAVAVKGIAVEADAVGGSVAATIKALRAHLLVELPIQHLRAYRAEGDSANLDSIGLSLLQVSLRPIPSPTATYRVMRITTLPTAPAGEILDADITPTKNRVDLLFPKTERFAIAVDPRDGDRLSVKGAFRVDDIVLVREFARSPADPAEFADLLQKAGVQWEEKEEYGQRPLPLLTGDLDPTLSPFQKFGSVPSDWKERLIDGGANFGVFLGYLIDAFKSSPDDASLPVPDLHGELTRPEREKQLRESYMVWSARFFPTAPLGWVMATNDPLEDAADYMAVAQPKSADPLKIAADGRGRLLFTRFAEEEWANERSYAVMPVGRYERLWALAQPPATADKSDDVPIRFPDLGQGRADIDLPRIRRLEAPKLLLARLLRSEDGRTFNELILSHAERTLSQTNVAVSGKLAFGEIRRKYVRQFIHVQWPRRLAKVSLLTGPQFGLPQPLARTDAPTATPHDLGAAAETLLAAAPQARWDSTRYVDAAEPFYYRQSLHFEATASVDVVSDERTVVLPTPEPDLIRPIGDPPVTSSPINWSVISAAKQKTYQDWLAEIGDPSPIADRLRPEGFRLSIRLPRLIESLNPESLAGHFAYENKRYERDAIDYAPVGFLPDPDVRIVILDQSTTTTIPIAQIVPKSTGAAGTVADVFEFNRLSSDFFVPAPDYTVATDWADGIIATLSVRPCPVGYAVQLATSSVPVLTLPDVLSGVDPTQLLAPTQLPKEGPLLQLTPLALRLELVTVSTDFVLAQVNPLTGGRWLGRPHLTPSEEEAKRPLTQDDLTIGLRLIMDLGRRRAAALLGWDIAASAGSAQDREMAVGLLQRVEESDIAILLERAKPFEVGETKLKAWAEAGILAWHREPSANPSTTASWKRITTAQTANNDWNLITIKFVIAANPADQPAIDATVDQAISDLNAAFLEAGRKLDKSKVIALNRGLERLAGLTFRTIPTGEPTVVAQRGNAERVDWPKAM
ncbi:MAG: hypothetical protein ACREQZ_11640 [Woeseiaceae bacterium]